jgi:hypothetical protein
VKTCLIIGNGPSLADIPNEFLDKYPSFGSNRIYLKYTPTYYAFVDRLWVGNYIDDIVKLDCKYKHIRQEHAHKVQGAIPIKHVGGYQFSIYPLRYVFGGHTITYVNMQLAYYYGFRRVLLVGVDHFYHKQGALETKQKGKEQGLSHFTKDYYSEDDEWIMPDVRLTEPAYRLAKHWFEGHEGEIINLTPGTKLDVFEKQDWHDW